MNGYCTVPIRPHALRIDQGNVIKARQLFGSFLRQSVRPENLAGVTLVPVPSKDSFNQQEFRSLKMLRDSVAAIGPVLVEGLVRYNQLRPKASEGGGRGYDANYPYLSVRHDAGARTIILVDDILTTGGTMLATRNRLQEAGHTVIRAVVCGKTTAAIETAFQMRTFELADDLGTVDF